MAIADSIDQVLAILRSGQRFLVTSHARPDGDAIGSMLATAMILGQLGKQVEMATADPVPHIYRALPGAGRILHTPRIEGDYDAVILLECDGIARSHLLGLEGRALINIDHHFSGKPFGAVNWIDPDACAVAEMVYDLARAAGVSITPEMATCLYTAVLTDTGSFCYEGTDAHTFELARELVEYGAHPAAIAQDIYFANPEAKMRLLGAALSSLRREGRLAWMWLTHRDMQRLNGAEEDCEGLVNYAISISGVEAAVFLRELADGSVRLSIRSKGQVNVALVAEAFGGGGHHNASGCTLDGPLARAAETILARLRQTLLQSSARTAVPSGAVSTGSGRLLSSP